MHAKGLVPDVLIAIRRMVTITMFEIYFLFIINVCILLKVGGFITISGCIVT